MPANKVPMVHTVKIWPEYYEQISIGLKTFEVRVNDRDYKMGDILVLRWFDPKTNSYSEDMRSKKPELPLMAEEFLEFPNITMIIGYTKEIGDELIVLSLLPYNGRDHRWVG